jgi:hypothetical protein
MNDAQTLIRGLSRDLIAVQPLPSPSWRTLIWLAVALPYVVTIVFGVFSLRPDLGAKFMDWRYVGEQTAALVTALVAAWAAFSMTIPGSDWRRALVPLVPLAIWIGLLGEGCLQTAASNGWRPDFTADLVCFPMIIVIGFWPAVVMVAMLRQGAPLQPHVTVAMGAMAAAGLGNVALRLFHGPDVSLTILVWQVGSALVLAWLAGLIGPSLLKWRTGRVREAFGGPERKTS